MKIDIVQHAEAPEAAHDASSQGCWQASAPGIQWIVGVDFEHWSVVRKQTLVCLTDRGRMVFLDVRGR